jgi:hypothetical protein
LQHLASGGEHVALPGGAAKQYDEHGRLVSTTFEEFAGWAVAAGLMPATDLAA